MLSKLRYLPGLILLLFLLMVLFAEPFAPFREKFQRKPTVVYESLPLYRENDEPFYQPETPSPFTEISGFKDIETGNHYAYETPILLSNNIILTAGYIEDENRSYQVRPSIFSADVTTGQVYWQTIAGSTSIATDGKRVFAETIPEAFKPIGVVVYEITSGEIIWQTTFEIRYAIRVASMAARPPDLIVNTFHRPHNVFYILDPETGDIKERRNRYPYFQEPVYNGLVFRKEGYSRVASMEAIRENDGSSVWRYDQPVVSNIAVGGSVTYFVTRDTQLVAVNTRTGDVLGILSFIPTFPDNFHFGNDQIIVAADGDLVAIYFRDRRQLSIFRFLTDKLDD